MSACFCSKCRVRHRHSDCAAPAHIPHIHDFYMNVPGPLCSACSIFDCSCSKCVILKHLPEHQREMKPGLVVRVARAAAAPAPQVAAFNCNCYMCGPLQTQSEYQSTSHVVMPFAAPAPAPLAAAPDSGASIAAAPAPALGTTFTNNNG